MRSFLNEVAHTIMDAHPEGMEQVCVVFNNRRPSLFLRREMSLLRNKPFLLPQMLGMDDLVARLSGLHIQPPEFLLFELYDIHRSLSTNSEAERFEDFISLGEMMLADFSEVDLYGVDARSLFDNLHDLKRLGEWDIEGSPLTPFQLNYLTFYRSLYGYYEQLRTRLLARQQAYSGMAYRHVADQIESLADQLPYTHIYFVGFNVLPKSEQASENKIIHTLVRQGKATLLVDGDTYYCDNEQQEAGLFLRRISEQSRTPIEWPNLFAQESRQFTAVSCAEDLLQAKYAGSRLRQLLHDHPDEAERTALVLADESLLLQVLNSLPAEVHQANVSMGFPFTLSAGHALASRLLNLYTHMRGEMFYHKDLLSLYADPIICKLHGVNNIYSHLQPLMVKDKIVFANGSQVADLLAKGSIDADATRFLFDLPSEGATTLPATPDHVLSQLRQLIDAVDARCADQLNAMEDASLTCLSEMVDYLLSLQTRYRHIGNLTTLLKLYNRLARRRNLSLYGEPLKGLQVLGMLETRNLDFDNVVLLSTNEGVLPSGRTANTLIPHNLKVHFHMPTYQEKDAIYAYHFYSLLQRARNVTLIYHTEQAGTGKGEASRFLAQLRTELLPVRPNISWSEATVKATNERPEPLPAHTAFKDEAVRRRLGELAEYGFSPSALNTYRNCPLQFYYSKVLNLHEVDEIDEDMDYAQLGNCIHATLQHIYSLDTDGHVRIATLQTALTQVDNLVEQYLAEDNFGDRSQQGHNYLYKSVAVMQIKALLRKEIDLLRNGHTLVMLAAEQTYRQPISIGAEHPTAYIRGTADRIDQMDGRVRVVDYKSGSVKKEDLNLSRAKLEQGNVPDKWFQVATYAWLYARTEQLPHPITSGIYPLRTLHADFMEASLDGQTDFDTNLIDQVEELLESVVGEIMSDAPFVPKPDYNRCQYCPFDNICRICENEPSTT
ncbi:MAG: PD-(D/E)XK nuclease family protein [Bacteroidales bacterium]|nr:PD-(D/E)XK nuclease family protein [Bacteroidales bacterium]